MIASCVGQHLQGAYNEKTVEQVNILIKMLKDVGMTVPKTRDKQGCSMQKKARMRALETRCSMKQRIMI